MTVRGGAVGDEGEFRAAFLSLSRRWFWWFLVGNLAIDRDGWQIEPLGVVLSVAVLLGVRRLRAATAGPVARALGWALGLGAVAAAVDVAAATPGVGESAELVGLAVAGVAIALFAGAMAQWLGDRGADPGLVRAWRASAGLWLVGSVSAAAGAVAFGAWAEGGDVERAVVEADGPLGGLGFVAFLAALVIPLFHTAWTAVRTGEALERQTRGAGVRPAEA